MERSLKKAGSLPRCCFFSTYQRALPVGVTQQGELLPMSLAIVWTGGRGGRDCGRTSFVCMMCIQKTFPAAAGGLCCVIISPEQILSLLLRL